MVLQKHNHRSPDPRGIIFDCDGTLADTMPLHWRAWQVISRRHGFALNEERFYSLGGVPSRDILKLLSAEQGIALDPLAESSRITTIRLLGELGHIRQAIAEYEDYRATLDRFKNSYTLTPLVNRAVVFVGRQWLRPAT